MPSTASELEYVLVPESKFKAILSGLDRKKYRVEKVDAGGSTSWIAIRLRRKGLYRTAVKDDVVIRIGYKDPDGYHSNTNLSELED